VLFIDWYRLLAVILRRLKQELFTLTKLIKRVAKAKAPALPEMSAAKVFSKLC